MENIGTHKRVFTVNRVQFASMFDDENYKSAISNADGYKREVCDELMLRDNLPDYRLLQKLGLSENLNKSRFKPSVTE